MIACINTCKAQDSINTPKIVLEYLYKQDIKVSYLSKDTANLKSIIENKDSLFANCELRIANRDKQIEVQNEELKLYHIQIQTLSESNKRLTNRVGLWKVVSLLTAIVGSVSTIYFVLK